MKKQLFIGIVAIAVLIGLMTLLIAMVTRRQSTNQKVQDVEIWLSKPVSKIKGITWTKYDGKNFEVESIEQPSNLILHLPNGKVFQTQSKHIYLFQKKDLVTNIITDPLMDPVSFDRAKEEGKIVATKLNIKKESEVWEQLNAWSESSEWSARYMTREELSDKVSLSLEINNVLGYPHETDNWFIVVKIRYDLDKL